MTANFEKMLDLLYCTLNYGSAHGSSRGVRETYSIMGTPSLKHAVKFYTPDVGRHGTTQKHLTILKEATNLEEKGACRRVSLKAYTITSRPTSATSYSGRSFGSSSSTSVLSGACTFYMDLPLL